MKVVVLHDQVADQDSLDQQDVLIQAQAIIRALAALGYEPIDVSISLDFKAFLETIEATKPAFVFNLVESLQGKGRLIHLAPSLLDYLRIPYTGAGTEALFTTSNKLLAKDIMHNCGITTPRSHYPGQPPSERCLPLPGWCITKLVWEHGSAGIGEHSVIHADSVAQVDTALRQWQSLSGEECFAEEYIEGREICVAMLASSRGVELLPASEIVFEDYPPDRKRIVDYRAKWEEGSFEYSHTPRSFEFSPQDRPLLHTLNAIALKCWSIFNLRGYARVDFRVDLHNRPWVLEVNANPCLSPEAGFAYTAEQAGLSYQDIIRRLVDDVILRPPATRPQINSRAPASLAALR